MVQQDVLLCGFYQDEGCVFARPVYGKIGDQSRLTVGDGAVLALPYLDLQDIVGGLGLQKREGVFAFCRNKAPVVQWEIPAMVAHLIDFSL